jgi:ribonuclease VapC
MFVDSSAVVAMMSSEEDGEVLAARLDNAIDRRTSPLVLFETVLAIRRLRQIGLADVNFLVQEFLQSAEIRTVGIDANAYLSALQAFESYGKGTGHPARLNMGDCFSYAMAKNAGVPLLYKGNDFSLTDLA